MFGWLIVVGVHYDRVSYTVRLYTAVEKSVLTAVFKKKKIKKKPSHVSHPSRWRRPWRVKKLIGEAAFWLSEYIAINIIMKLIIRDVNVDDDESSKSIKNKY